MPATNDQGWEERKQGSLWKPEQDGQPRSVSGVLQNIRSTKYGNVYDLIQEDGTAVTVPRSAYLDSRIDESDIGSEIKLEFVEMQATAKGKMRTFKIFTKPKKD